MLTIPRTKGEYGHRDWAGRRLRTDIDDSAPTMTPFGMSQMCTWLYLDCWDDDGPLFEAHRTILGQEASVGFLLDERLMTSSIVGLLTGSCNHDRRIGESHAYAIAPQLPPHDDSEAFRLAIVLHLTRAERRPLVLPLRSYSRLDARVE